MLFRSGNPLPNATVTLDIVGGETATVTSGPSDANGVAEANWNTSAPNRKVNERGQRAESGDGIISFELLTPISVNKRL